MQDGEVITCPVSKVLVPADLHLAVVADAVPGLLGYWDTEVRCRFANRACLQWFGKPIEAILGSHLRDMLGETVYALNEQYVLGALRGEKQRFERTIRRADGRVLHAMTDYTPHLEPDGRVSGFSVLVSDVTELKEAETRLGLAATVFDSTIQAIAVIDGDGLVLTVNRAFTTITGYQAGEVVGQRLHLFPVDDDEAFLQDVRRQIVMNGHWQREVWGTRRDGTAFLALQTMTVVDGASDRAARTVCMFTDDTELWRRAERIRHLASHDPLTDLPNRAMLFERLEAMIDRAGDTPGGASPVRIVVMFLDLDRFKLVNDTFGHDMGDAVLMAVALRLANACSRVELVSRLGGDEFVMLLDASGQDAATQDADLADLADRIVAEVSKPVLWNGMQAVVGVSVGIAAFPEDGARPVELLQSADKAMYAAKQSTAGRADRRSGRLLAPA